MKKHELKVKQGSHTVTVNYELFEDFYELMDMFNETQIVKLVERQVLTEVRWKVGRMMKAKKAGGVIQAALDGWRPLMKKTAEDKDKAALKKLLNKYHDSEEAVDAFIDKLMSPEPEEEGSHELEGEEAPF